MNNHRNPLILKENYFTFNHSLYQQMSGVATGTPIAPTFANFFMSKIEECFFLTQWQLSLLYKCYIDNISSFGHMGWTPFNDFITNVTQKHSPTHPLPKTYWNFLNLTIYADLDRDTLRYRLYTKRTNSHQYGHASGSHQKAPKLSATSETVQTCRSQTETHHYRNRGYSNSTGSSSPQTQH